MHSITSRITGLMFLSILFTVVLLVYLANHQMSLHFGEYLAAQPSGMGMMPGMGSAEQTFLDSIHRSLYWVGGAILLVGSFASYILARTSPYQFASSGQHWRRWRWDNTARPST